MCIENLKKNLRYLRKKHGFTQPFIAELLHKKSYTTIQKWEEGNNEPSFKDVHTLSQLYGVNIDDFVKVDLEARDAGVLSPDDASSANAYLFDHEKDLISDFRKLNNEGQEKGSVYIHDLSEMPKYQKEAEDAAPDEKEAATSPILKSTGTGGGPA